MKEILVIEYDEIKKKIEKGSYLQAFLAYQLAPYKIIAESLAKVISADGGLSSDDANNLEKIILAGSKANAKK